MDGGLPVRTGKEERDVQDGAACESVKAFAPRSEVQMTERAEKNGWTRRAGNKSATFAIIH
jgi:hypothetical protein